MRDVKSILFLLSFGASLASIQLNAQINLDSLKKVWNDPAQSDTNRLKAVSTIGWYGYLFTKPDSAFYFATRQYQYAEQKGLKKYMAAATNTQGAYYYIHGNFDSAIYYYEKGLEIYEEMKDKKGMAAPINNLGNIYKDQGHYAQALHFYLRSLELYEQLNNTQGMAMAYGNIGLIYSHEKEFGEALDYYSKSLQINQEQDNQKGIAGCLNNMGLVYEKQAEVALQNKDTLLAKQKFDSAYNNFYDCLEIEQEIGNLKDISVALDNIGSFYQRQGHVAKEHGDLEDSRQKYQSATNYFLRALAMDEQTGNRQSIAGTYVSLGSVYLYQNKLEEALDYSVKGITIAREIGLAQETKIAAQNLHQIYRKLEDEKNALMMLELFVAMRDSIETLEDEKEILRLEYKHGYDKKKLQDDLKHQEMMAAEVRLQHRLEVIIVAAVIIALVILIFMFILRRKLRESKDQRMLIEQQKESLSEQHNYILSSISYAQRIQLAMLPSRDKINKLLPESFILFQPKEMVSGDFYWMESIGDNIFWAVADCTGHGVPGAFISIVGYDGLNDIIVDNKTTDPAEILERLSDHITEAVGGSEEGTKIMDGMDMALCCWDTKTNQLYYSGAYNPVYIVRTNGPDTTNPKESENLEIHKWEGNDDVCLIEIKATHRPIGRFKLEDTISFVTHNIQLNKNDQIYMFTDGIVDQFGGPKVSKYSFKQLKSFLMDIHTVPIKEQRVRLFQEYNKWKGSEEQLDDICVIGVKV